MTDNELKAYIGQYRTMLFRLAYSSTQSFTESDDIVEEAFIRLYTCSKTFPTDDDRKAWLIRVTVNLCKNRSRLKWNSCRGELTENTAYSSHDTDESIDLKNALKRLKPNCRTVIFMHYYEGYSTEEIARYLGISQTAVTTRLQRGRETLKGFLTEE